MDERLERFDQGLKSYDHQLRVVWRQSVGSYVIERQMRGLESHGAVALQEIFHGQANREMPQGFDVQEREEFLIQRRLAQAKLEALREGHRYLFQIPDLHDTTLQHCLYTFKRTDYWVQSNFALDRDVKRAAAFLSSQQQYEEDRAEARRKKFQADENRALGGELLDRARTISGDRMMVGG